ncbi:hypothetical protein MJO29_016022 [Puccinia striiformis f. sp. tritici]|nr:hypothetical protein Pst134EB_030840 [Puccinia striiformis f. sp. tritici]KAI7934759.1 hypothetical protein MJO29_016022 [Puccinia striiformis f. sp. tritici]KAI9601901.1 hypothetical protein KEM48_001189 [Puccinia striiformis f. sp. tritici PST-130]
MVRGSRPIQSPADDLSGEDALASHIAAQESASAELRARHRNTRGRAQVEHTFATHSTADDLSGEDALASHIAAQESARAELRAGHRNNRGRALVEDELVTLETNGVANGRGVDQADFEEIIIPEAPQNPRTFTAMAEVHQRYRESLGPSIDDFKSMKGIEQALETLPPDSQTRIRNFYERIRAAYVELWDEDPNRTPMSSQEVSELFGPEEASVVLENMDELQSERILSFFHSFERVFNRKNSSLGPQLPNLAEYLDRVSQTPDSPSKLVSDDPENADVSCAMCLTEYQPSDTVVPLPCGSSHHFHRNCAEGWLVAQPQCPVCRTPIEIRREYSNTTYDGPILTQA